MHRARAWMWLALAATTLVVAGCKKEAGQADKEALEQKVGGAAGKLVQKATDKVDEARKIATDDRRALGSAEYEELLLALKDCELDRHGIDRKCEAYRAYRKARSRNTMIKDLAGMISKLGLKYLTHESDAVRYESARMLKSFFGSGTESQEAVLKHAPDEKNPLVLARMISAVGSRAGKNPGIAEFVLKMADHESPVVRKEVITWLTSSGSRDVKGAVDKVIEKLEQDEDEDVRLAACRYAGKTGDERLIPIYRKMIVKPDKDPKMYSACMQGLAKMWNPFLSRDAKSEQAYKLFMAKMKSKPRTREHPPWIVMNDLGREPRGSPTWYDRAAVVKLLTEIVLDDDAHWMARTGGTRALGKLKARAALEQARKKYGEGTKFEHKSIAKEIDRELRKL